MTTNDIINIFFVIILLFGTFGIFYLLNKKEK